MHIWAMRHASAKHTERNPILRARTVQRESDDLNDDRYDRERRTHGAFVMNRQTSALPAHPYSSSQLLHEVSAAVESAQALPRGGSRQPSARGLAAMRRGLSCSSSSNGCFHGLAWIATQVNALKALRDWAVELRVASQRFNEAEQLVALIGCGEYLAQLLGRAARSSQTEFVRPAEMGIAPMRPACCKHRRPSKR